MSTVSWSLPTELRARVAKRTGANLYGLAFAANKKLTETNAEATSTQLEQSAYVSAQAQSATTTGSRPEAETTKLYIRKLAELVVEFVKSYVATTAPSNGTTSAVATGVFDLSGGSRDFLSKDSAERHFEPLLNTSEPPIHTVILSTKSFGTEAAEVACRAFKNVASSLRTANLSDIIGGRPEAEALQVLKTLGEGLAGASLVEIDLSNNAFGEKGLRACQQMFTSQLEIISLHNIGCSPNACAALKELTARMQLKGLYLYNNMSGDEGGKYIGEILSRMASMECFQMASSRVGSEGVLDLAAGLCSATNLQALDLNDNPATEESVPGIVKLLHCQSRLKRLNLSDTSLGDSGVSELSTALLTCAPNLEVLELALNEISFGGATALSQAIAVKKSLKKLDLHENELEDGGTLLIAKAIEANTTLEEINLCENMMHRVGALVVAKALKGKPRFQRLSLDANQISAKGIALIEGVLEDLFKGRSVLGSLEENEDEDDEEDELDEIDMERSDLESLINQIRALKL